MRPDVFFGVYFNEPNCDTHTPVAVLLAVQPPEPQPAKGNAWLSEA